MVALRHSSPFGKRFAMLLPAVLIGCLYLVGGGWAQEETWSGLVNSFGERLDYLCPDDLALSGVAR